MLRNFGHFNFDLDGRIAFRLDLTTSLYFHPALLVEHTKPVFSQPEDIQSILCPPSGEASPSYSERHIEVQEILIHKRNGSGYSWFTLER